MITRKRGRKVPVLALAASFVLLGSLSSRANAQWRSAVALAPVTTNSGVRQIDPHAIAMPNEDTWRTRDLWKWAGIGALVGAAATASWVGVKMAQSDGEAIGVSPMTILIVAGGVGGVGGGLGGALAYALAHPAPEQSP